MIRATPAQLEALDALIDWGTPKAAAHHLGISVRGYHWRMEALMLANAMTTPQLAAARGRERRKAA